MKWRSSTSRLVLAAALLFGSAEALAQTPATDANATAAASGDAGIGFPERYQRAMTHYKAERYREAIVEFQAAYALQKDPKLLINIGRAYFKLGQADEAITHYERFLREDPTHDATVAGRVQSYLEEAKSLRKSQPPVSTTPPTTSQAPTEKPPETAPPSSPDAVVAPPGKPSAASPQLAQEPTAAKQPDAKPSTPIYKRWWLWTIVGLVAAGGAATAAVLATRSQADDLNGLDVRKLQFGLHF